MPPTRRAIIESLGISRRPMLWDDDQRLIVDARTPSTHSSSEFRQALQFEPPEIYIKYIYRYFAG